jgi:hypothetical protein
LSIVPTKKASTVEVSKDDANQSYIHNEGRCQQNMEENTRTHTRAHTTHTTQTKQPNTTYHSSMQSKAKQRTAKCTIAKVQQNRAE